MDSPGVGSMHMMLMSVNLCPFRLVFDVFRRVVVDRGNAIVLAVVIVRFGVTILVREV